MRDYIIGPKVCWNKSDVSRTGPYILPYPRGRGGVRTRAGGLR